MISGAQLFAAISGERLDSPVMFLQAAQGWLRTHCPQDRYPGHDHWNRIVASFDSTSNSTPP
jgi:hypothetical protein